MKHNTLVSVILVAGSAGGVSAQVLPAPHPHCDLVAVDVPAGAVLPAFDAAGWSVVTDRTAPQFQVIIDDPFNQLSAYAAVLRSNLGAACARWAQVLDGPAGPVLITIVVRVDNNYVRSTSRSEATVAIGSSGGYTVYEQGAAHEVRTGVDPNGAVQDAVLTLNTAYVADELWFDPDPAVRTAPVPAHRTDAVSVFLHELGHVLAFNGWRDSMTGQLPGGAQSTFDERTTFDGDFYFEGEAAGAAYGGPVPLTYGSARHVGNQSPRPGADLIPDLMNGMVFYRGTRYDISALDIGLVRDCGVTVVSAGQGCDSVDFNQDGLFPDTSDIDDFLSVFSGGACSNDPQCSDVDFNNDGLFPDTLDIDSLLSVFSGGGCLV
ncbi:MAG: hypothetical protein U0637_13785 [Phycisphaerales bacterium]